MKATITTFKQSGKWYDTFFTDVPDYLHVFDKHEIEEWLIANVSQCKNMNFIYTIDHVPQLCINPRASKSIIYS